MANSEQRKKVKEFSQYWENKGYEKGESQPFWLSLLRILGISEPEKFISFEDKVMLDHTSFIDGYIPATHVLIEQKSKDKDLRKAIKQSDGTLLSPFQQAKRYSAELPYSQRPRWIITCNFQEFLIYDMEKPTGEPESILLKDLSKEYYRLQFLAETGGELLKRETEISVKAGEIVGILYDKLFAQYKNPDENSLKSLNVLCVRLVFCLYAEDTDIFGKHMLFHDYLKDIPAAGIRKALIELFKILDTQETQRDKYLSDDNPKLAAFPYVNGGLFADEYSVILHSQNHPDEKTPHPVPKPIEIPPFTEELKDLLLRKASENFDWSKISPTIFGAVFESTLNPETRRSGGMHYTSVENIHKVIDPLFLDDLKEELAEILNLKILKIRNDRLDAFTDKLSKLKFLDPACGSGNFLTETYISLRKLENEVLRIKTNQIVFGDDLNPIKVSISQFYGIEINDFAATVAKTALWIAESQAMKETEDIVQLNLDFLPLKTNANIIEGNALRLDWNEVVAKHELDYIMGNPPFVGANNVSKEQKTELFNIFGEKSKAGLLDYVTGWYKKSAELMDTTAIKTAFVSTNSITQGEQAAILWKSLSEHSVQIDFAHRTFKWNSEASEKAAVHCVIIGFSQIGKTQKQLYDNGKMQIVKNINPYLVNADNVLIERRKKPLSIDLEIRKGNQPTDGGNLIIEADEYDDFIKNEPSAKKYIKKLIGAKEYINGLNRYCLWLVDANPNELKKMPLVTERIKKVREMRLSSTDNATRKLADYPTVFRETNNPKTFIVIPSTSSENRKYIPMGFLGSDVISTNSNLIIPDATIYHFGVLTSNVHMAWVRAVCGRLKSDYRYSKDIVYNNFPWCSPTDEQKRKIEQTAQAILDARALYTDSSLADLYDDLTMPPELRKAHQANDRAVMQAYGFPVKNEFTESMCVAELMKMYKKLTKS